MFPSLLLIPLFNVLVVFVSLPCVQRPNAGAYLVSGNASLLFMKYLLSRGSGNEFNMADDRVLKFTLVHGKTTLCKCKLTWKYFFRIAP